MVNSTQPTQWEIDWAQEDMASPVSEVSIHELMQELQDAPDSELYNLALALLRESGESQH